MRMMLALLLVAASSGVYAANATPDGVISASENLRLSILKKEKSNIESNLQQAMIDYGKAIDKKKTDLSNEINSLKGDLAAIDIEIANTHLPPVFIDATAKQSRRARQKTNGMEEPEFIGNNNISPEGNSQFESWDVFHNFNRGK